MLHAEWTKFRTVRGWVIGMIVAPLVTVGLGQLISSGGCSEGADRLSVPAPLGPGGEAVTDSFYFVRRPLAGNGSITVRVTSLTVPDVPHRRSGPARRTGLQPWSKAGIIMAASTRPGAAYAAMMVTAGHGVRMQYDYTGDTAGLPGAVALAAPRWLRLARSGDTVTGYDSADGTHWARVGAVHLAGLPGAVQAGLFAASPPPGPAGAGSGRRTGGPTPATATFDHVSRGAWPPGAWTGTDVGRGSGARAARAASIRPAACSRSAGPVTSPRP